MAEIKIIDPHLHLFALQQGQYQWLRDGNPPLWPDKKIIQRDFGESNLQLASPFELAGFVHIEAGFDNQHPTREIAWWQQQCQLPMRSVAYVDLLWPEDEFQRKINKLKQFNSVVGVRDILEQQALHKLSNPRVQRNLAYVFSQQLLFELQMSLSDHEAVTAAYAVLQSQKSGTVIINHAGLPPLPGSHQAEQEWQQWLEALDMFSRLKNCAIKCSGWEMAERQYSQQWLRDILQACLYFFGSQRVMLASNFPLCLFSQSYQQCWQQYQQLLAGQSAPWPALCYDNAWRWYRFD